MTLIQPLEIVDSHLHFWQLSRKDYFWLSAELGDLYQDFLPKDWQQTTLGLSVNKAVVVQAAQTDAETDFLLALATENKVIAGVVGWVNMLDSPLLVANRLLMLAGNTAFKGIRPMLQDIEDINWILKPNFEPIFELLVEHQLTFDALVRREHLSAIFAIAKKYPGLNIVINHCAKPSISQNEFELWAKALSVFSELSNVYVKVSGLPTEASKTQQNIIYFTRYFEHVLSVFGVRRMMWGSDWPVVNLNSSYKNWFELSQRLVSELALDEQSRFWSGTASEFYRLK
ncbi:amidohydrolase family protein [Paraglaciecola sp.]|uniref:amidohydrolase family protein n=1 Tax=Paraglaciecola sp. TaxID=1920173 RepID=UPI003EFA8C91